MAESDSLDGGAGDDVGFYSGNASDYSVTGTPPVTISSLDPLLDGDDSLVNVQSVLFEDSSNDTDPISDNPWSDDLIARLKGSDKDVDGDEAVWLLFQ